MRVLDEISAYDSRMHAPHTPMPGALDQVAGQLAGQGYAQAQGLFGERLLSDLQDEARHHAALGELSSAATGHGAGRQWGTLRGDSTLWLDDARCGAASKQLLAELDVLRVLLSRRLMLGLVEIDAHFAQFPAGAGYSRHRDRFRDDDTRVLSLVCYLNRPWPEDAGGALRLHLPDGPHDIAPRLDTTVMFLSEQIEHEVLPAMQPRLSIAAWFRRRAIAR